MRRAFYFHYYQKEHLSSQIHVISEQLMTYDNTHK